MPVITDYSHWSRRPCPWPPERWMPFWSRWEHKTTKEQAEDVLEYSSQFVSQLHPLGQTFAWIQVKSREFIPSPSWRLLRNSMSETEATGWWGHLGGSWVDVLLFTKACLKDIGLIWKWYVIVTYATQFCIVGGDCVQETTRGNPNYFTSDACDWSEKCNYVQLEFLAQDMLASSRTKSTPTSDHMYTYSILAH